MNISVTTVSLTSPKEYNIKWGEAKVWSTFIGGTHESERRGSETESQTFHTLTQEAGHVSLKLLNQILCNYNTPYYCCIFDSVTPITAV